MVIWLCVLGSAWAYLREPCHPESDISGRRALRSSAIGQLLVPRYTISTGQRRAFSIVGHSTWNGLPLDMCLLPRNNANAFNKLLKTNYLYCRGWSWGTSE